MDSREIDKLVDEDYQLTCPRCNADLNIALTREQAKEKGIRTGIFCPVDESHVGILFEFTDTHLAKRKLFDEMRAEREKQL